MNNQKRLLFVGAHPDDETFGIGGTLAQYAAAGVEVYYTCATRGEAGSVDSENMGEYTSIGDLRWAELQCAAAILGIAKVVHLGYRDSGMPGSADNHHPEAMAMSSVENAAGRIVHVIREIKPQVVITHDPIGGYRHPDHIAVHNATVRAFHVAGDPLQYPESGPPYQPGKLYYHIFPRFLLKFAVKVLPLFGQDPHKFGRNKDVDLASLIEVEFPVHAVVKLSKHSVGIRNRAASCYASQMSSGPPRRGILNSINALFGRRDLYMRAHPPADIRLREKDLFEDVSK